MKSLIFVVISLLSVIGVSQSYENYRLIDSLFPFQNRGASIKKPIPQIEQLPNGITDSMFVDYMNYIADHHLFMETDAQVLQRYGLDTNVAHYKPVRMQGDCGVWIQIEDAPTYVIEAQPVLIGLYGIDLDLWPGHGTIDVHCIGEEWFLFSLSGLNDYYQRGLLRILIRHFELLFTE
jgi:hypothetical protein